MQPDKSHRRIRFVDMSMSGHASRSGYTQITNTSATDSNQLREAKIIAADDPASWTERALMSVTASLAQKSGNQWYNRRALRAEWRVVSELASLRDTLVHYLYGENNYRYTGEIRRTWLGANSRLIATYHTPEARFKELIQNPKHIAHLDAVVIMSEVQRSMFSDLLSPERVHFVPHGVDTEYFSPRAHRPREKANEVIRCITVGNHLRDYPTLFEIASEAKNQNLSIEFTVVAKESSLARLNTLENVSCFHGIDDDALLSLYQRSDVLLLPLIDATANNTLLEGMACGLPVLASDLTGVRDYVPLSHALLAKRAEDFLEHLAQISSGRVDLAKMGSASRKRAEELSWSNVRAQLSELYENV